MSYIDIRMRHIHTSNHHVFDVLAITTWGKLGIKALLDSLLCIYVMHTHTRTLSQVKEWKGEGQQGMPPPPIFFMRIYTHTKLYVSNNTLLANGPVTLFLSSVYSHTHKKYTPCYGGPEGHSTVDGSSIDVRWLDIRYSYHTPASMRTRTIDGWTLHTHWCFSDCNVQPSTVDRRLIGWSTVDGSTIDSRWLDISVSLGSRLA